MQKLIQALPDALVIAGGVMLSFGAGMIYRPAGFIVGGLLMLGFGFLNAPKTGPKAGE